MSTRLERRETLTRDRVLRAAVELADREGIGAVSMRRLGQELGVEAMSLYTHVRSKEDLLDGMVDLVVAEVPIPARGGDWQPTLRSMILSARGALLRHRWAPALLDSRTDPGPATLRYVDAAIGVLRSGGFSLEVTHHALHVFGSRMFGFSQDLFDDSPEMASEAIEAFAGQIAGTLPNVAEIALAARHEGGLGPCDDDVEFTFALDLLLDGLERRRDGEPVVRRAGRRAGRRITERRQAPSR
jgi:AcrR family transcriptional regulator